MRFVAKALVVLVGAIALCNLVKVGYVIASVKEGALIYRIEPYIRKTAGLYVVKLLNYSIEVTYSVAVCIVIGLRLNFVHYRIVKPVFHIFSYAN